MAEYNRLFYNSSSNGQNEFFESQNIGYLNWIAVFLFLTILLMSIYMLKNKKYLMPMSVSILSLSSLFILQWLGLLLYDERLIDTNLPLESVGEHFLLETCFS